MTKIDATKKMTPGRAIRAFCLSCCGGVAGEVKTCDGDGTNPAYLACVFHKYRIGTGRPSVKTIRKFCLYCMGGAPSLVRDCTTTNCNCYTYRLGNNPARAGMGSKDMDTLRSMRPKKDLVSRENSVYSGRSATG